jgi:hypothetical protein
MSVPASPAVREPNPASATLQPDPAFDARWAAWLERGRQHDLAARRTLRIALLAAAIIGLLVAVVFGLASGAW